MYGEISRGEPAICSQCKLCYYSIQGVSHTRRFRCRRKHSRSFFLLIYFFFFAFVVGSTVSCQAPLVNFGVNPKKKKKLESRFWLRHRWDSITRGVVSPRLLHFRTVRVLSYRSIATCSPSDRPATPSLSITDDADTETLLSHQVGVNRHCVQWSDQLGQRFWQCSNELSKCQAKDERWITQRSN